MRVRQGRKNKHNLYLIVGDEPSDDDISIGYIKYPNMAEEIVRLCNLAPGGVVPKRTESTVVEASWERAEELRPDRLGPEEKDVQNTDPERPGTALRGNS